MVKQFLKPNLKKIIIFAVIFVILVVFRGFFESNIFFLNQLLRAPFLLLTFPFYFLGEFGSFAATGLVIGIVGLIFWYLVSCLIAWIIDGLEKKSS